MSFEHILPALHEASSADPWARSHRVDVSLEQAPSSLVWAVPTSYGTLTLRLQSPVGDTLLTAHGDTEDLRRVLRNTLVRDALLKSIPREHHVLVHAESGPESTTQALNLLRGWAERVATGLAAAEAAEQGRPVPGSEALHGFWWDRKANFGDAVGPWLAATLSQRDVVNVRPTREKPIPADHRAVALVGSIIHMINRPDVDIWGAGLMRPLSESSPLKRLTGVKVHAVRGHLTRDELMSKLDWEVPEMLGDPALLLSRHYRPRPSPAGTPRVTFVPHMSHRPRFRRVDKDLFDVVDVREDLTTVVDRIANAEVCVSTSLHGLIIAQTYGVPWVWLNITDAELGGGEFKFNDFFSTLTGAAPARVDSRIEALETLDLMDVAAQAVLPELNTDLDALEAAFPDPHRATPASGRRARLLAKVRAQFARR